VLAWLRGCACRGGCVRADLAASSYIEQRGVVVGHPFDERARRPRGKRLPDEVVPIHLFAAQCDKERAWRHLARVDRDAREAQIAIRFAACAWRQRSVQPSGATAVHCRLGLIGPGHVARNAALELALAAARASGRSPVRTSAKHHAARRVHHFGQRQHAPSST
jgi:hypothetical protein